MAIGEGYKTNFETLQKAVKNGDIAIMECKDKATGDTAILVCAVQRPQMRGGEITMVPLARMIDGNPYELYEPPA